MGFWARLFGREQRTFDTMDPILAAILKRDNITRAEAMNIPAFAACVKFITETTAALPVKLYRDTGDAVEEVTDDRRVALLNEDTGDLLTGYQFKQALAADILIDGAGYAYINRVRNDVLSLHYVDRAFVSFIPGADPVYKSCAIMVNGQEYREFEFIKATLTTKDGVRGYGILAESSLPLAVSYNMLLYENVLAKTGGSKKGFLKAEEKLEGDALNALKDGWARLYSNNSDSVIILNKGLDFKEASSTSVELQMNENKLSNAREICKLFTLPPSILEGGATEEDFDNAVKQAVQPVLRSIEAALNRDLLLDFEKPDLFFAFDTKELLKGSIEKRYAAYKAGIESNVLSVNEARFIENLPPLAIDFIRLNLRDVLYDPYTKTFFAPNTGQYSKLGEASASSNAEGGNLDDTH